MSDRTVGVGIIGSGFARTTQIPCFQAVDGIEVVAILSRNLTRAFDLAKEFGIRRAFDDLDRFLALPEVDLVSVASPPHLHLPQTLAALRANKHVLCEKPTALHAGEAARMLEAARESDRIHLIDHELRFHPRRRRLGLMLEEGFTGNVYSIDYRMLSYGRADPERPWTWWADESRGGGVLGALGSHVVDAIRVWLGEVAEVRADLATMVRERPDPETGEPRRVTSDDHTNLWLRLESGVRASVSLSVVARETFPSRTAVQGERGSLLLDGEMRLWSRERSESEFREVAEPDAPSLPPGTPVADSVWSRSFALYAAAIRDAIASGARTVPGAATFEDGLRNQAVLDAARLSAKRADWVPVAAVVGRA